MSQTLNEDQFPIVPAIGFTVEKLWSDRLQLLEEARVPFFGLLLVAVADITFRAVTEAEAPSMPWLIIIALATLLVLAPICIRWQRVLILGEDIIQPGPVFSSQSVQYVVTQILIGFTGVVVAVLVSMPVAAFLLAANNGQPSDAFGMVAMLGVIVAFAVTARLNLVLAGVAVDDASMSFRKAWNITQGNGLRLATGLLLIGAASLIVTIVVSAILQPLLVSTAPMTLQLLSRTVGIAQAIFFNLIFVGYVARAYLHFRGQSDAGSHDDEA